MRPRSDRLSGIVQQECQVKDQWVMQVFEQFPVTDELDILGAGQRVQLIDANQSMLVGGVTMEILVLNEAGQVTEFRQIAPEKIGGVHQAENSCSFPFAIEHTRENFARRLAITKLSINEAQPTTERVR